MYMRLKNKTVLITGGARMGEAIAKAFAREGYDAALTYHRSKAAAEKAARAVRKCGRRALLIKADLRREKDCQKAVRETVRGLGGLRVLVNMASLYEPRPWKEIKSQDWNDGIALHLHAAWHLSREAAAHMQKKKQGSIIHFADWNVKSGRPRYKNFISYYSGKAGILGLTEALALELAPEISVNAIAPGPILPVAGMKKSEVRKVLEETPLRRWGGPEAIAETVLFLAQSSFITGECVRVDGGRHLR